MNFISFILLVYFCTTNMNEIATQTSSKCYTVTEFYFIAQRKEIRSEAYKKTLTLTPHSKISNDGAKAM